MRVIVLALTMAFLMPIIVAAESERDRAWKQNIFEEMTPQEYLVEGVEQLISVGVSSELAVAVITCRVKESKAMFMAKSRQDIEKIFLADPYKYGRELGLAADNRCAKKIQRMINQ